jgi:hypothetical protein
MELREFIATTIREYLNEQQPTTKSDILRKAKTIKNSCGYMNCHYFSQKLLGYVDKKTDLIKLNFNVFLGKNGEIKNLEKLNVGDLLEFNNISHYSIYIGDGDVIEVEQWGAEPRIIKLADNLDDFEGSTSIYRKK